MTSSNFVIGIDVGGTFTDYTIASLSNGDRWSGKILNSSGYVGALLAAIDDGVARAGTSLDGIQRIVHGTTISTNAILEGREDHPLLVTTGGFEDVLEIGRHDSPRSGDIYRWLKPRRPIDRHEIVGVDERMTASGTIETVLTQSEMDRITALAFERGVRSVAVVLLHSAINPDHELALGKHLEQQGFLVSLSHAIDPGSTEYERSMATVLNAYVQPVMSAYLDEVSTQLASRGCSAPLYLMASDGGVLPADVMRQYPITSVLSGPVAGARAVAALAARHGISNALSLDVGGTSSDVAALTEGTLEISNEGHIGPFALGLPTVRIHTVGAGGGSIARVTSGRFAVGPKSAKADPGPACYGLGGHDATVTDALVTAGVVTGRQSSGGLHIDAPLARGVIEQLAGDLGQATDLTASAVIELANVHMGNALRHLSIERGRDPRDFSLVAFGGGGGAHAVAVARHTRVRDVLIPSHPGVFSTEGLVNSLVQRVFTKLIPRPAALEESATPLLEEIQRGLISQALEFLGRDQAIIEHLWTTQLDIRYVGQGSSLSIDWNGAAKPNTVARDFADAHKTVYGYSFPERPIEVTAVRVLAQGRLTTPPPANNHGAEDLTSSPVLTRAIWEHGGGATEVRILHRSALAEPQVGPFVIDETDTTILVPSGATASLLSDATIRITWE